jgi:hypothetical protein
MHCASAQDVPRARLLLQIVVDRTERRFERLLEAAPERKKSLVVEERALERTRLAKVAATWK